MATARLVCVRMKLRDQNSVLNPGLPHVEGTQALKLPSAAKYVSRELDKEKRNQD